MRRNFDFRFKEETGESHKIYVEKRPDIPGKKSTLEFAEIPGREELVELTESAFGNLEIPIRCSFKVDPEDWGKKARELRRWLYGSGKLTFSDSQESFYKVKKTEIGTIERPLRQYGIFDVVFTCSPMEYIWEGQEKKMLDDVLYNKYYISHPIYYISGNGECTITANGKPFKARVENALVIDTDRMLTYRENEIANTNVTGDYEDLYLLEGENKITVTAGFTVEVTPNWRCL